MRGIGVVGSLAIVLVVAACEPVPDGVTLRTLAGDRGRHIGTAVEPSHLASAQTVEFLAAEFSVVTAENALKWGPVHPERDRYDFDAADLIVATAEASDQIVRGHTLVWHRQNPAWLVSTVWTRDEAIALLETHIATVVGRYRGRVAHWDVVNEAIADDGSMRDTFWLRAIGPDYVTLAFEFAHAADPGALLYYNDYLLERAGPKADAVHALVSGLLADGVPIHGIGYQMHVLVPELMPEPAALRREFVRYADLGIRVAITEMDVALILPSDADDLGRQADAYDNAIMACLGVAECDTIVFWGWRDDDSWIEAEFPGFGDALLFDRAGRPKPVYTRLRGVLWWNLHVAAPDP